MNKNNLKVLLAASECSPLVKVGGLGDVIGSLPRALKELGIDVRVALPKYSFIDAGKYSLKLVAGKVKVGKDLIDIYQGLLPGSEVLIYFLENEKYFGENGIYFEKTAFVDSFKEIKRFLFFSKAVLEIPSVLKWFPQIIHCHDWHTSILPILAKLKSRNSDFKTLLTIHNLANQGKRNAKEVFDFLGLNGDEDKNLKIRDRENDLNILQLGIISADILNTVSLTYSKEILTGEYGRGLESFILKRKKDLYGILNGIDESRFDPEKDADIKRKYSLKNLDDKSQNKIDLQMVLGLPQNPKTPLLGIINRLTSQKGVDLIIEAIPEIVKLGCQLVILGVGTDDYEKKLLEFSQKYPNNISVHIKFDAILAQKIYAGCDIFLMPSSFEPCGLGQMIAQKYGTLPLVRKTGGLADTVEDKKTGFVFKKYKTGALLESLKEALELYKNQKKWKNLMKKAMIKDSSWPKSAKGYLKLYKKLLEK